MSTMAQAAQAYRDATQAQRDAKREFIATLRDARIAGMSAVEIANQLGYSRERIYQLLQDKEKGS